MPRIHIGQPTRLQFTFDSPKVFTANATTNKLAVTAHGYIDGNPVTVMNTGGVLPGGLEEGVEYYVLNKTDNDFQLALTPGGTAIDLTNAGSGTNEVVGPFDPATVTLLIEDPDGADASYVYPGPPATLSKLSTGEYYKDFTPTLQGIHQGRWETPDGVHQFSFTVLEKNTGRVAA